MSFIGLRPDADCFSDSVRLSTGPYKYQVDPIAIKEPSCPISECNVSFNIGARQADIQSMLWSSNPTRMYTRGRPSTQLYGTAPVKRMGDGVMYAVEVSNNLRDGFGIPLRCVRPESEYLFDRFDYIDMPNNAESWRRGGISARFSPVVAEPMRATTPIPSRYVG